MEVTRNEKYRYFGFMIDSNDLGRKKLLSGWKIDGGKEYSRNYWRKSEREEDLGCHGTKSAEMQ